MDAQDLPGWIKVSRFDRQGYEQTNNILTRSGVNTVCKSANCPNRYECFSNHHAAFLILGDICTRNCRYCNVTKGVPTAVDFSEPEKIAQAVKKMCITYAVVTSVTRDDLSEGGASHFAEVIRAIRKLNPRCRVEVLVPDFHGNSRSLKKVLSAKPDVLNHNIEVAKNLFPLMRPGGSYAQSISLLKNVKQINPKMTTKSGFMIGLGETMGEILETASDLKEAGCDIATIGQYLSPSKAHAQVKKYYSTSEFEKIKNDCKKMGFAHVAAGPLVRSSYMAGEMVN